MHIVGVHPYRVGDQEGFRLRSQSFVTPRLPLPVPRAVTRHGKSPQPFLYEQRSRTLERL